MHIIYHDDNPRPYSPPRQPWLRVFAEAIFNAAPLAFESKRRNAQ